MRTTSFALIASLVVASASPAWAEGVTPKTLQAATKTTPAHSGTRHVITIPRTSTGATLSEEERYAVREAISKEAKNFRGGDAIVITATTAIIILLAVIIIILVT